MISFQIPWAQIIGLLLIGVIVVSMYKAHRDPTNNFNVFDLVIENGHISKVSCVFLGTWAALTYVFVGSYLTGKMTEGLFTSYGGLFIAPLIARMFSPSVPIPPPPQENKP